MQPKKEFLISSCLCAVVTKWWQSIHYQYNMYNMSSLIIFYINSSHYHIGSLQFPSGWKCADSDSLAWLLWLTGVLSNIGWLAIRQWHYLPVSCPYLAGEGVGFPIWPDYPFPNDLMMGSMLIAIYILYNLQVQGRTFPLYRGSKAWLLGEIHLLWPTTIDNWKRNAIAPTEIRTSSS